MTDSSDKAMREARARTKYRRRRWAKPLVRYLGSPILRMYSWTWRRRLVFANEEAKTAVQSGCLAVLWHGRGLSLLPVFRGHQAAILVSPAPDGRLITDLLEAWKFEVVNGSTRHEPAAALRKMLTILKQGRNICITPDGPPGPEHTVSSSIAFLSRGTGFPVVPLGVGISRSWRLGTYDRYTVPKPFCRVTAYVGEPIHVPRDARGEEAQAEWTERIRQGLMDAETSAFGELGLPPEP